MVFVGINMLTMQQLTQLPFRNCGSMQVADSKAMAMLNRSGGHAWHCEYACLWNCGTTNTELLIVGK